LLDEYLDFLAGRCRPNTVLAVAFDLKVFFTVVGKSPKRVRPADVLAVMTAQRAARAGSVRAWRRCPTTAARQECRPGPCAGACRASRGCTRSCMPAGTWPPTRFRGGCRPHGNDNGRGKVCR